MDSIIQNPREKRNGGQRHFAPSSRFFLPKIPPMSIMGQSQSHRTKEEQLMKFISWNVNGLRACMKKGFLDFYQSQMPDFMCLQ